MAKVRQTTTQIGLKNTLADAETKMNQVWKKMYANYLCNMHVTGNVT